MAAKRPSRPSSTAAFRVSRRTPSPRGYSVTIGGVRSALLVAGSQQLPCSGRARGPKQTRSGEPGDNAPTHFPREPDPGEQLWQHSRADVTIRKQCRRHGILRRSTVFSRRLDWRAAVANMLVFANHRYVGHTGSCPRRFGPAVINSG